MKLYKLREDILLNMDAITLIIDRGYSGAQHEVRIYTVDGQHEYKLSNEDWTRFQMELKKYEMG